MNVWPLSLLQTPVPGSVQRGGREAATLTVSLLLFVMQRSVFKLLSSVKRCKNTKTERRKQHRSRSVIRGLFCPLVATRCYKTRHSQESIFSKYKKMWQTRTLILKRLNYDDLSLKMRNVSTTRTPKNKEQGCYFLFLRLTPLKSSYKTSNQSFSAIELIQSFCLILSPCFTLRHLTVLLLWRGWEQIKARGVFGSTLFWFWTMICWNTLVRMFPISFCWFVRTFFYI